MPDWSKLPQGFHRDRDPVTAPFEVTIRAAEGRYSDWKGFPIQFTVANRSSSVMVVGYWTCSYYDNWRTDRADVRVAWWTCFSNGIGQKTMLPGEGFTGEIGIHVSPALIGKKATFRLAFTPYVSDQVMGVFWSNPISLDVVR